MALLTPPSQLGVVFSPAGFTFCARAHHYVTHIHNAKSKEVGIIMTKVVKVDDCGDFLWWEQNCQGGRAARSYCGGMLCTQEQPVCTHGERGAQIWYKRLYEWCCGFTPSPLLHIIAGVMASSMEPCGVWCTLNKNAHILAGCFWVKCINGSVEWYKLQGFVGCCGCVVCVFKGHQDETFDVSLVVLNGYSKLLCSIY